MPERILATLGGFFGGLGLIIAAIGLFGVLAFQVARRTNELAVRMALGASRQSVLGLVLRDVVVIVLAGVSIGTVAALMLTGLARRMLFGLTPTDARYVRHRRDDPRLHSGSRRIAASAACIAGSILVALRHE